MEMDVWDTSEALCRRCLWIFQSSGTSPSQTLPKLSMIRVSSFSSFGGGPSDCLNLFVFANMYIHIHTHIHTNLQVWKMLLTLYNSTESLNALISISALWNWKRGIDVLEVDASAGVGDVLGALWEDLCLWKHLMSIWDWKGKIVQSEIPQRNVLRGPFHSLPRKFLYSLIIVLRFIAKHQKAYL